MMPGGALRTLKDVLRCETRAHGAAFFTADARIALDFLDDEILRVEMVPLKRGRLSRISPAVVYRGVPPIALGREDRGDVFVLSSAKLVVTVNKFPLRLGMSSPEGEPLCAEPIDGGMGWQGLGTACWKALPRDAHFYGFGERTGYLDKRGTRLTLWNTDVCPYLQSTDSLYISIPFFIALAEMRVYGIFLNSPARTRFDIGKSIPDRYMFATEEGRLDYYFFAGPTIKHVVEQYTRLTGRIGLPPLWALGYQQSRYSYYPAAQVEEVARNLREKKIPCDVLYLDIHHMEDCRPFTFAHDGFADPNGLATRLAEMGFKLITIVDPGIKIDADYGPYQRGVAGDHFVRMPDGAPATVRVWPGDVHLPDFTRIATRRWWADEHKPLFDAGVAGIWNDMNEPAVFDTPARTLPLEAVHGEPGREIRHELVHNVYANLMAEATALAFVRFRPGERPFIVSRAGFAGIQRHACSWTGDNSSWWEHLLLSIPMCLGLGLSGQPYVGTDVGGFLYDADPELVTRWTQLGVFMPFFRNHSTLGTTAQEPYNLGQPYEDVCREFIRLRYRLIPYLYTLLREAAATGLPVMRPMVMEFPADPKARTLYDQFMFGRDILIAPIYQPGGECRTVYLPSGRWVDFWTAAIVEGGRHILTHAPLDRIPIYLRPGAIVPLGRVMSYTAERTQAIEELYIHPWEEKGSFDLYIDDGKSLAYLEGESGFMRFSYTWENSTELEIAVLWDWPAKICDLPLGVLHIFGFETPPKSVVLDGVCLDEIQDASLLDSCQGWFHERQAGVLLVGVNCLARRHKIGILNLTP